MPEVAKKRKAHRIDGLCLQSGMSSGNCSSFLRFLGKWVVARVGDYEVDACEAGDYEVDACEAGDCATGGCATGTD